MTRCSSFRNVILAFLCIASIGFVGCTHSSQSPSGAELRECDDLRANATRAVQLIDDGTIHPGQHVPDFLKLCKPYRLDFVGRYTFVEFYPVPNLYGLSLIAIDDKLVSARRWDCTENTTLFETITEAERRAALHAYEPRAYGADEATNRKSQ